MNQFVNEKKVMEMSPHRGWEFPKQPWRWYQEWNRAVFLHLKADLEFLRTLVPKDFSIDLFQGQAWISIVAFTMENVHPRGIRPFSFVSDFHEVNVRTYVIQDGKPGVYFLSIEAEKIIPTLCARYLSGLPYEKSDIFRIEAPNDQYIVKNPRNELQIRYKPGDPKKTKTPLDIWLTERYCLYHDLRNKKIRLEVQHPAWPLYEISLEFCSFRYRLGNQDLVDCPIDLVHYSPGVSVIAWGEEVL